MPELDIIGNFAAGQEATLRRRRARQMERAIDYELAREQEGMMGRRGSIRQQEELYGLEPWDFGALETNRDPLFQRLIGWWKDRRASRVEPTTPATAETQPQEAGPYGTWTDPAATFRHGGRVNAGAGGPVAIHAPRRTAIPYLQDGGMGSRLEELAQQQARIEQGRLAATRTPGLIGRAASAIRSGANRAGRVAAPVALGATAGEGFRTPTEQYRERFGFGSSNRGDLGQFAEDVGIRTLGAASDLGNMLTFGLAGRYYRDLQGKQGTRGRPEQGTSAVPPEEVPDTPDEAVTQQAIAQGTAMADEAERAAAPPGAIDFSKVDFRADEIPNMPVSDWVEYRGREVRNLMAQGRSAREAHAEVTALQQQGFIDYSTQALMHLQAGNAPAAASALRAAYQYFPNGSDIQIGVYQDPETGQPSLLGRGFNEESGEPVGNPMFLDSERLAVMIENFKNPEAFRAWTKDWRDEQFARQQYEEVEKPGAEADIRYKERLGQAALARGTADIMSAQGRGGRDQTDLDRANAAFITAVETMALDDPAMADRLASAMSRMYADNPGVQYPQVIDFINMAQRQGVLEQVLEEMGL
jgi:hypothetical protein